MNYYFAEQQIALREHELRRAAERSSAWSGTPARGTRRRGAGVARVLRSVADRIDSTG